MVVKHDKAGCRFDECIREVAAEGKIEDSDVLAGHCSVNMIMIAIATMGTSDEIGSISHRSPRSVSSGEAIGAGRVVYDNIDLGGVAALCGHSGGKDVGV